MRLDLKISTFFSSFITHWWHEWQSLINIICVKSALHTGVCTSWVTEFCVVVRAILCIIIAIFFIADTNAYYFSCTSQTMPDRHEIYRSFQNFGSSVWNLLYATLLVPSIWRWLLDFWKICGPLTVYNKGICNLPSFMGLNVTYTCEHNVFKSRLQWEYRIFLNLIRTSFCRFLKQKKS